MNRFDKKTIGSCLHERGTIAAMPRVSSGPTPGVFFNGDNLAVLRFIPDESVDLIYLDPPFNSQRTYNAIFKGARAQERAFKDCWSWEDDAAKTYERLLAGGFDAPGKIIDLMRALRELLGPKDLMAYLTMMSVRLVALYRVLKPTGSLYLHCDPTASHYLKVLLDAIFDEDHFRSEIIWKRSTAHSDTKQGRAIHGHIHDVILFYTKSDVWTWNPIMLPYDQSYIESHYRFVEEGTGRRYRKGDLTAAKPGGDTSYEWHGVRPYEGRYWAYSKEKMEAFEREGRLVYTRTGMPEYKRYLDEMPGVPLQDVWTDIDPINARARERTKFPTQKPVALLERIVKSSSNPGDLVLDPFCGCGTTIEAAQRLGRRWIGIDIADVAVDVVRERLDHAFPGLMYALHFIPKDVAGARRLALHDRNEFQWWALSLIGAHAPGSASSRGRTGADRGVDGVIRCADGTKAIVSVKSGNVNAAHVRDLRGVIEREGASIGIFVTLNASTRPMEVEALDAGFIDGPGGKRIRKLQIVTIEQLLEGVSVELPSHVVRPQSVPPPFAMPALQASMFEVPPAAAVPKVARPRRKRTPPSGVPYKPFDLAPAAEVHGPPPRASRVSEVPGLHRASQPPEVPAIAEAKKSKRRIRR